MHLRLLRHNFYRPDALLSPTNSVKALKDFYVETAVSDEVDYSLLADECIRRTR